LPLVVSALAQNTRRPDLVILCDDASTDASAAVFTTLCSEAALPNKTVNLPDDGAHWRLNTLRNLGIEASLDGLVILMDADVVPARTCLESHSQLHHQHPAKCLSTGPRLEYAYPDGSGPINFMWGHEAIGLLPSSKPTDPQFPTWQTVSMANCGFQRQAALELGGFDSRYDGHYGYDDLDFTWRAQQAGFVFAASWEAHVIHLPHGSGTVERDITHNQQKFQSIHGSLPQQPLELTLTGRPAWNEYYQLIRNRQISALWLSRSSVVSNADLNHLSGWLLLKLLWQKLRQKLGLL
jgi:glycosyltransferase involved in cell wall biosynthesis